MKTHHSIALIFALALLLTLPSALGASYIEAHNRTFDGGDSPTEMNGVVIKPLVTRNLTQVGVNVSVTATACRVYNVSSGAFLYNGSITSANCYPGTVLNAGSTYYVLVYSSGATYVQKYKNAGAVFPIGGTSINWTNGVACQSSLVCSGPVIDTYLRDVINLTMTDIGSAPPTTNLTYNTSATGVTNVSATIWVNGSQSFNVSICYGTNASSYTTCAQDVAYNTVHSFALNGLVHNTTYFYNVTGMDTLNLTNRTGPYNFTTVANPPVPLETNLSLTPSVIIWLLWVVMLAAGIALFEKLPAIPMLFGVYGMIVGLWAAATLNAWAGISVLGFSAVIGVGALFQTMK